MKVDLSKLKPLETPIDLYRVPDRKDQSGWRGPCELLDISKSDNQALVKYQSQPFIVPLRHIRPHVAIQFALFCVNYLYKEHYDRQTYPVTMWPQDMDSPMDVALVSLLDFIDQSNPGQCRLM